MCPRALYKKDVQTIENVQRRATRCIPSLKGLDYEERLRKLDMPTLKFRRLRGDMIEVYKILNIYDDQLPTILDKAKSLMRTGHCYKLEKKHARLQLRQHSFRHSPHRVVNA